MQDIERPITLTQLASKWGMDKRTLEKHFENLRLKFPDEDCLKRQINGRSVIYPSEMEKIKKFQVTDKQTN
tara:strand:- start:306 stop:518 length:213 start_codon:yes stop_codon:yes gene_type:complete